MSCILDSKKFRRVVSWLFIRNWHFRNIAIIYFTCKQQHAMTSRSVHWHDNNPANNNYLSTKNTHDAVIKWKHFPRYWPFVRGIHRHRWIPSQRPVTRNFDVFFDLRLNKWLSIQSRRRWFETPSCLLWHHCNAENTSKYHQYWFSGWFRRLTRSLTAQKLSKWPGHRWIPLTKGQQSGKCFHLMTSS